MEYRFDYHGNAYVVNTTIQREMRVRKKIISKQAHTRQTTNQLECHSKFNHFDSTQINSTQTKQRCIIKKILATSIFVISLFIPSILFALIVFVLYWNSFHLAITQRERTRWSIVRGKRGINWQWVKYKLSERKNDSSQLKRKRQIARQHEILQQFRCFHRVKWFVWQ